MGNGENVKRLRTTNWWLKNSHRNVKYSTGNIVNDIVVTVYSVTEVLEMSEKLLCKVYDCLVTILYT